MARAKSRTGVSRLVIAVHMLLVLLPLAIVVLWAFTSAWPWPDLLPASFSTRGLTELLSPAQNLVPVIASSMGIALAVAVVTTIIAAMAARGLVQYRFRGRELFRFSTALPFLIPTTVFAMGVQVLFIQMGLTGTLAGVVLAHTIVALPYAITIMSEVTAAAGTRFEQQAKVLGANSFQTFYHVQIPLLLPGLLSAASLSYILSFSQYFITLLIGGGVVRTFALAMFPYLASGDRTIASAYGVVFMLVTFGLFLLFELLIKRATRNANVEYFTD